MHRLLETKLLKERRRIRQGEGIYHDYHLHKAFYVGGSGRIARLDDDGSVSVMVDSPHAILAQVNGPG